MAKTALVAEAAPADRAEAAATESRAAPQQDASGADVAALRRQRAPAR